MGLVDFVRYVLQYPGLPKRKTRKKAAKKKATKKARKPIKKVTRKRLLKKPKPRKKKTVKKTRKKAVVKVVRKPKKKRVKKSTRTLPKRRPTRKKPAKKRTTKKPVLKKSRQKPLGKHVGVITHYFGKIAVGIVKVQSELVIGDKIRIKGATTDFTQFVGEMQINHTSVMRASRGSEAGMKVAYKVHEGDRVYRMKG